MKVLVCGDAMVDRYHFGDVTRISPEAPVPVVAVQSSEDRQGGAANVARNIEAMGVEVVELYSESYRTSPVVKMRAVARNQQLLRLDWDTPQLPIEVDEVARASVGCDVVVLSDYGKGALRFSKDIVTICKAAGKMVLVDPKGKDPFRYTGADVIKPNLLEMARLVGDWTSDADLHRRAQAMMGGCRLGFVLLTMGAAGMRLYDYEGQSCSNIAAVARDVYDVSGAGDTAIAALAAAIARGHGPLAAAKLANRAAAVAVSRFGTTVVTLAEVPGL